MTKKQIKEMQEWIIHPDTTYVIETEEEYELVCERIDRLFDMAIKDNLDDTLQKLNSDTPNMLELNKLVDAVDYWEERQGR